MSEGFSICKEFNYFASNSKVMNKLHIFILSGFLILLSCSKESVDDTASSTAASSGYWLVPFEDILYWGDPTDEIIAIDNPSFEGVAESNWSSQDRMLIQYYNEVMHVYPVTVLEEHEIINDQIDDYPFAVSYCPITGSGMTWGRSYDGQVTEFGVSGMLYHDNLVLYDRNTHSYWSQMLMLCIHGEMIESVPQVELVFESDFGFVKQHFPEARVLMKPDDDIPGPSTDPKKYKDVHDDVEPGSEDDERILNPGEYYFGVVRGMDVKIFSWDLFPAEQAVITTSFRGKKLIVAGSPEQNFIVAFEAKGQVGLEMKSIEGQFPVIMEDGKGNQFTLFGEVVSGPDVGVRLKPARAYRAKGFAWESIFSRVELVTAQ